MDGIHKIVDIFYINVGVVNNKEHFETLSVFVRLVVDLVSV